MQAIGFHGGGGGDTGARASDHPHLPSTLTKSAVTAKNNKVCGSSADKTTRALSYFIIYLPSHTLS